MRSSLPALAILAFAATSTAQATWWVSPTGSNGDPGTQAQPFQTINHANSIATSGDTIRLLAGTFGDEQGITILGDKDIAVVGAGSTTIVRAHSTLTTNIDTGFVGSPVPTQQRPVFLVQGSARVDLRAMMIDGGGAVPASGRLTGVYYRNGADGVVSDIEIVNCQASPLTASQGPAGVVVRGDSLGDTCHVTLRNCLLHHWGKVGAAVFFNADLTVEDCRVVGDDHELSGPAQVGIQIAYDASGTVKRTAIADIFYEPAGAVAVGILCYDAADDVLIEDNGIANCEHAIYFYGGVNTTLNGVVRRNRVVSADAGVYLDNIAGILVEDNHLQLSLDLFANAGFSNTAGNTWNKNCYSSYPGVGGYPIPGGGGNVDATPRRGVDLLDAPSATPLPIGHSGRAIVTAQLDGAGLTDFATVDENSGLSVTVGLNTGGAFSVTTLPFAPNGRPIGIVAAELNNSPGIDLAVLIQVTTPTAGASVYTFANNGSGTFTVIGNHFLSGTLPSSIAAGDLNGDAVADLMVAGVGGFGGGSAILLSNLPPYGTNYNLGIVPSFGFYTSAVRGVAIADVAGDPSLDVLVTEGNQALGRLHVFVNNGFGGFTAQVGSPFFTQNDPTAVAARDLDGDGDNDILVSYGTSVNSTLGGVMVMETIGATHRKRSYNTDYSTNAIALGDIDDDGAPDGRKFGDAALVNTDGGTITVLGGYVGAVGFSHGGIAVNGQQPTGVAFGNFDGDAFGDLFYTNGIGGQVVVLPGRPSARTDHFGFGTTESFRSRVPYVAPVGAPGVPTQPNLTLGIELKDGRPFTLAAIVGSLAPAGVLAVNDLQFNQGLIFVVYLAITDVDGACTMPFGLPAAPSIHGMPLYFQGGVFDLVGSYVGFPGIALSRGLKVRVGF